MIHHQAIRGPEPRVEPVQVCQHGIEHALLSIGAGLARVANACVAAPGLGGEPARGEPGKNFLRAAESLVVEVRSLAVPG